MASRKERDQTSCLLAHDLINKLSAIVGYCDLLVEKAKQTDLECAKGLSLINELAKSAAKEITDHQCELYSVIRRTEVGKDRPV